MPTIDELEKEYLRKHPKSKELYERALKCYPSGVTHDARFAKPFPIYAVKALGALKREGFKISLGEFAKAGLLTTFTQLLFANLYILIRFGA